MSDFIQYSRFSPGKHICIVTTAAVGKNNPIRIEKDHLVLIFVIERQTGTIIAFDMNTQCRLTAEFVGSIFIGKNIISDLDEIRESISLNYFGASARSITSAVISAHQRFSHKQDKGEDANDNLDN